MISFNFDSKKLISRLEDIEDRADTAILMYAETAGKKLQSYARDNAKWTDRTGDARKRLNSSVERKSKLYRIKLAHGVDYGIWLELAHEKRFSIIQPSITLLSPEIIEGLTNLLNKLS